MTGLWHPILVGVGLAFASISYYVARRISFSGSGHISRIVDVVSTRKSEDDELIAAMLEATEARFGSDMVAQEARAPRTSKSSSVSLGERAAFLGSLVMGGALSNQTTDLCFALDPGLDQLVQDRLGQAGLLLVAGLFVGFGARLAGGCTTGHGLVGVSQLQKGSLVSTTGFFMTGVILTSILF
jgi:hypothetical protein